MFSCDGKRGADHGDCPRDRESPGHAAAQGRDRDHGHPDGDVWKCAKPSEPAENIYQDRGRCAADAKQDDEAPRRVKEAREPETAESAWPEREQQEGECETEEHGPAII